MPENENAMIPAEVAGGLAKFDDEVFNKMKSGDFLPRLQLMTANSDKCKSGEFTINHYAFIRDQNFQDLGETVDVLIITWRPKALEIGDEVLSVFDPEHEEFARIQEKSAEANSGCMYGPEFLVYIPQINEFATFFCGSKSSRREAPNIRALMTKPATLKSRYVETKKYKWYTPAVTPCSTPFNPPDMEALKKVVDKFNNPPKFEKEVADEPEEKAGRER